MSQLIERLIALEADVRYNEPPSDSEPEFLYLVGQIPILLSAPHGAVHTRRGAEKEEDEYTAGFARLVAELANAHVLYARRKSNTDPNWDRDVPYKQSLRQIIEQADICFVLDIHGASAKKDFGIALGTLKGKSCPRYREVIIDKLERWGFKEDGSGLNRLDVDKMFTAGGLKGKETISATRGKPSKFPPPRLNSTDGCESMSAARMLLNKSHSTVIRNGLEQQFGPWSIP